MTRKIGLITLLTWLRKLRPMPDWSDPMATRVWLIKLLEIVDELAADTETLIDDKLLIVAHRIIDNEVTWKKFHVLVLDLVQTMPGYSSEQSEEILVVLAKAAGVQ